LLHVDVDPGGGNLLDSGVAMRRVPLPGTRAVPRQNRPVADPFNLETGVGLNRALREPRENKRPARDRL